MPYLRIVVTAAATLTLAATLVITTPAHEAQAAGLTVTTLADTVATDGQCSLREAMTSADSNTPTADCAGGSGADTITFAMSGTILLTSPLPIVTDPAGLTLDGSGHDVTLDGVDTHRILESSLAPVAMSNLTLTRAVESALYAEGGTVTVDNTSFLNNRGTYGGAISSLYAPVYISNSTFIDNTALRGGAIYIFAADGSSIRNSTFTGNSATIATGAYGGGGAIMADILSDVAITNSTIVGNSSGNNGGGLWVENGARVANSIVYGNSASGVGPDCFDELAGISAGNNIFGTLDGCTMPPAATDLIGVDPMLAGINDNGGPVPTLALQQSSPAIDAGNNATCEAADARGISRPQASACDIGAYEALQLTVAGATATEGATLSFPVALSSTLPAGFPDVTITYSTADRGSNPATAGID